MNRKAWAVYCCFFSLVGFAQNSDFKLEFSNLKSLKNNHKSIIIEFDLTNIGNEDIELPYQTPISSIDIVFENNENTQSLLAYQYLIIEKLSKQTLVLPVGSVKSGVLMKFSAQKKEIYKEKKRQKQIEKTTQLTDSSRIIKDSITLKIFTQDSVQLSTTKDTNILKPILVSALPATFCGDFSIDSIWIIQQKKKSVSLGILIKNIGNQELKLWGETPEIFDNLTLKAYLSSLDHKTNSAYFLRGLYIQDEAKSIGGILEPNQTIQVMMELNLKAKTKFTPYILLEINALQNISECKNDNNFKTIHLN
jgi:hypothetical protein